MIRSVVLGILTAGLSLNNGAIAQELSAADAAASTVLIDARHYNLVSGVDSHSAWMEEQGLRVRVLRGKFDSESLIGVGVVMTASPSAPNNAVTEPWLDEKVAVAWQPLFCSAFSHDEIEVLREWVTAGGGLVIVFDHMPVSNAVEDLAAAFGIELANGHAYDERRIRWEGDRLIREEAGAAFFRRSDGTRLAFRTHRDANFEIYLMDADGSNLVRLTNHPDAVGFPAWSPDGSRIAFKTDRDERYNSDIYVMNADGSRPVRLTDHPRRDHFQAWSPYLY